MRSRTTGVVLAALLAPAVATATKPPPSTAPSFGLTVERTKVGDSSQDNPLYAGGQHAMRRYGNDLVVVYPEPASPGEVTIRLGRSTDGGLHWEPARVVFRGAGICDIGTPMAVGPDPAGGGKYRVHVGFQQNGGFWYTWATIDPAAAQVWMRIGQFSPPVLVSGAYASNGYYSVAADAAGGVHIVFDAVDPAMNAWYVFYSRSADFGATLAETAVPVAPGGWPVLAADAAGDVYLAYLGETSGTYVARRAAGAPAFAPGVLVTATGGAEVSLASSSDGARVYLAWVHDGAQTAYHVARSADAGATWATFDGPRVGQCYFGPSVEVSPAGKVGLAFTDYCTDELRYVQSTDGGASFSAPAVITDAPWGATVVFDALEKANVAFVEDFGTSAVYFTKEK